MGESLKTRLVPVCTQVIFSLLGPGECQLASNISNNLTHQDLEVELISDEKLSCFRKWVKNWVIKTTQRFHLGPVRPPKDDGFSFCGTFLSLVRRTWNNELCSKLIGYLQGNKVIIITSYPHNQPRLLIYQPVYRSYLTIWLSGLLTSLVLKCESV